MKKVSIGLILLAVLGTALFFWLIRAEILSSYLTNKMRVPVSIERISFWPKRALIREFTIKNPSGFKTRRALQTETIEIDFELKQLLGNQIVIDQIAMDQIVLNVEFLNALGSQNNWTAIAKNMPKQKSQKEVIIKKLILSNLSIEIKGFGLTGKTIRRQVSRIEIDDISSREGFPTEQLIRQIFGGAGILQYIQDVFNPQQMMQKALSPLNLFGVDCKQKEADLLTRALVNNNRHRGRCTRFLKGLDRGALSMLVRDS